MEKNDFSLFNSQEPKGFSAGLIEAMLNAVPVGLQFLRSIRDSHNNIIDFEYVSLNSQGSNNTSKKRFLDSHPLDEKLFESLKQLEETGIPFQSAYSSPAKETQPVLNFIKFLDGILISGNAIDKIQKSDGEKQQPSEAVRNPKVNKESRLDDISPECDEPLVAKLRELEMLNAELKTINSVAAIEYKETIQRLYTNLEYIVSNNANTLNDASKANIRRAQATIQRMKLLSDDINHFLQLYDFGIHKTIIDPNSVLESVVSGMKGKIEQTNTHIESARMPNLFADPFLLSILFTRLLDNAMKFRKLIAAPVIRVKYSKADEMNSVRGAIKDMPYIVISVSDNGVGFPDEESKRIFDLFYHGHTNEKYKGSGIGLAVCKKIMTMHGGFITAEGIPASGAVFDCFFPLK